MVGGFKFIEDEVFEKNMHQTPNPEKVSETN